MKITSTHILFLSFFISFLFLFFDPLGVFNYVYEFTGLKFPKPAIVILLSFFITWVVHKILKKKYDEYE